MFDALVEKLKSEGLLAADKDNNFSVKYKIDFPDVENNETKNDIDDLSEITETIIFLMEKQTDQMILMKLANIFIETQLLKKEIDIGTGNFKQR